MPRFFFDTDDGQTSMRDVYGLELTDQAEACHVAIDALPDMAREAEPSGEQHQMAVHVRDEAGQPVLKATLNVAVEWSGVAGSGTKLRLVD